MYLGVAFYVVIGPEHLRVTGPHHQDHTRAVHSVLLVSFVSAQLLYTVGPVQRIIVYHVAVQTVSQAALLQRQQRSPVAVT